MIKKIIYFSVILNLLFPAPESWTSTPFDYLWYKLFNRMKFREPISMIPFDARAGYVYYGGNEEISTLANYSISPIILDSIETQFDVIQSITDRQGFFFEVDLLKINWLHYIYKQNFIDCLTGVGYRQTQFLSRVNLPSGWKTSSIDGEIENFGFKPLIRDFNINTSINWQLYNWFYTYFAHSIGYSHLSLYESLGGDRGLYGRGVNESFAIGIKIFLRAKNSPYGLSYGLESKLNRTKIQTISDPYKISQINGIDLKSFGVYVTFGAIFGGKKTPGDNGFISLINKDYLASESYFLQFVDEHYDHPKKNQAEKMLDFINKQKPYQKFNNGLIALKANDLNSAISWFDDSYVKADEDLRIEISSQRRDIALMLVDSLKNYRKFMIFDEAIDIINKALELDPNLMESRSMLAQLFIERGDVLNQSNNFDTSIDYYLRAQAIKPNKETSSIINNKINLVISSLAGRINQQIESQDYILAIQDLETLIIIKPHMKKSVNIIINKINSYIDNEENQNIEIKYMNIIDQLKNEMIPVKPKIVFGMSFTEVEKIIGPPDIIDNIQSEGKSFIMWTYNNNKVSRLYFEDYLLVRID